MRVHLHIDRLVLEGLPLGTHDAPRVQAAVEAELARLVARGDIGITAAAARQEQVVTSPAIGIAGTNSDRIGQSIAQAVMKAVAR